VLEGDYSEGDTIVVERSGDALTLSKAGAARAKSA